jgi:hypothetical protein
MHTIDYGHERDGILYHGTISDLDGVPASKWTYEEKGKKVTRDQPIDQATFHYLWNCISKLPVFRRSMVRDPDRAFDPLSEHVIGIAFTKGAQVQRAYFAVPANESDPEFLRWLEALNVPTRSAAQPRQPNVRAAGDKKLSRLAAAREKVYPAFFGKKWSIRRESPPQEPPIDIYVFDPGKDAGGDERDFYTLVTSGMSDSPMNVPDDAPFRRAELLLYVDDPADERLRVLQWLARLPLTQQRTWYGPGTTMTNGQPPEPIFDNSELDCFFFMRPIFGQDDAVHEKLVLDGDPTTMLWVVPITHAECKFIQKNSPSRFVDLLIEKTHPLILDETRRSYIRPQK